MKVSRSACHNLRSQDLTKLLEHVASRLVMHDAEEWVVAPLTKYVVLLTTQRIFVVKR
ncbi:hypothetical protein M404DRAFT_1000324 [Pisolithus tinctorius Marx 270]|uniref:Uncharacterized protein n=1 Tax=Pisolithus tinctorius Marx 270 TaxID=870435 RepID=A0A0C3NV90_PISTI|nr:hypothetical protein M404DRAFT_1000324 [Pisolithus tinctorius Marx 270]